MTEAKTKRTAERTSRCLHGVVQRLLPNVVVDDHPYDIGYWGRRAGLPKPSRGEKREGWEVADKEMAEETQKPLNDV